MNPTQSPPAATKTAIETIYLHYLPEEFISFLPRYSSVFDSAITYDAIVNSLSDEKISEAKYSQEEWRNKAKNIYQAILNRQNFLLRRYLDSPSPVKKRFIRSTDGESDDNSNSPQRLRLNYQDYFNEGERCAPDDLAAKTSPLAYLVAIYRFALQLDNHRGAALGLLARRPDLEDIELNQSNTYTLVPVLQLVNEIVEAQIAQNLGTRTRRAVSGHNKKGAAGDSRVIEKALSIAQYPLTLPFHRPWQQIIDSLAQMKAPTGGNLSLGRLMDSFHQLLTPQDIKPILQLYSHLNPAQLALLTAREAITEEDVRPKYGVNDIELLKNPAQFCAQTALQVDDLDRLLGRADFIPKRSTLLPTKTVTARQYGAVYIHAATEPTLSLDKTGLTGTSLLRFDRLNRFIRLQKWTNLAYDKLDRLIKLTNPALLIPTAISTQTIQALGLFRYLQQRYAVDIDVFLALIGDINGYALGEETSLLDRLFDFSWTEPLSIDDTEFDYTASEQESLQRVQQLCAACQLTEKSFHRVAEQLQKNQNLPKNTLSYSLPVISALYRLSQLARLLGYPLEQTVQLLTQVNVNHKSALQILTRAVPGNEAIEAIWRYIKTAEQLKRLQLPLATLELLSVIRGEKDPDVAITSKITAMITEIEAFKKQNKGEDSTKNAVVIDKNAVRYVINQYLAIAPERLPALLSVIDSSEAALLTKALDASNSDESKQQEFAQLVNKLAGVAQFTEQQQLDIDTLIELEKIDSYQTEWLSLPHIEALQDYTRWRKEGDKGDEELRRYFDPSHFSSQEGEQQPLDDTQQKEKKRQQLIQLLDCDQQELQQALTVLSISDRYQLRLLEFARLLQLRTLSQQSNLSIMQLQQLYDLVSKKKSFEDYRNLANGINAVLPTDPKVNDVANEQWRDALVAYYLAQIAPKIAATAGQASYPKTREQLYQYLLIDSQVSNQVNTSRVVQATESIQQYINAVLLDPTGNTSPLAEATKKQWQQVLHQYDLWMTQMQLQIYPQNYLDPGLRHNKTRLFSALENQIKQSGTNNDDRIQAAVLTYLNEFEAVANLKVISGYFSSEDPENAICYLIGKTRVGPAQYYWRTFRLSDLNKSKKTLNPTAWTEWQKIDLPLSAAIIDTIRPVFFNNRLEIIWVEASEKKDKEKNKQQKRSPRLYLSIKSGYKSYDNTWSAQHTWSSAEKDINKEDKKRLSINANQKNNLYTIVVHNSASPLKSVFIGLFLSRHNTKKEKYQMMFDDSYNKIDINDQQKVNYYPTAMYSLFKNKRILQHQINHRFDEILKETTPSRLKIENPAKRLIEISDIEVLENSEENKNRKSIKFVSQFKEDLAMEIAGINLHNTEYTHNIFHLLNDNNNSEIRVKNAKNQENLEHIFQLENGKKEYHFSTRVDMVTKKIGWFIKINSPYEINRLIMLLVLPDEIKKNIDDLSFKIQFHVGKEQLKDYAQQEPHITQNKELDLIFKNPSQVDQNYPDKKDYINLPAETPLLLYVVIQAKDNQPLPHRLSDELPDAYIKIHELSEFGNTLAFIKWNQQGLFIPKVIGKDEPYCSDYFEQWKMGPIENEFTKYFTFYTDNVLVFDKQQQLMQMTLKEKDTPDLGPTEYIDFSRSTLNSSYHPIRLNTLFVKKLINTANTSISEMLNQLSQNTLLEAPLTEGKTAVKIDFDGANGLYFWELFFYMPWLVAQQLNTDQYYAQAEQWLSYIFNPRRIQQDQANSYWQLRPLYEAMQNSAQPHPVINPCYLTDNSDPHRLALSNPQHYCKAIFLAYIKNLIDQGDSFYRQLTRERLGMAKQYYFQALELLGESPKLETVSHWKTIRLKETREDRLSSALTGLETKQTATLTPDASFVVMSASCNDSLSSGHFKIPFNKRLLDEYWGALKTRLYRLRHNLTLDGKSVSLPLLSTPLEEQQRLAFPHSFHVMEELSSQRPVDIPAYRFPFMLTRAQQAVEMLTEYGNRLLSTLESQSQNRVEQQQQQQLLELSALNLNLQQQALQREEEGLTSLQISDQMANQRYQHYKDLYEQYISPLEIVGLSLRAATRPIEISTIPMLLSSVLPKMIPRIAGTSIGGGEPSAPIDATVAIALKTTEMLLRNAENVEISASYDRRREEWQLEYQLAEKEKQLIAQQLSMQKIQITVAKTQLEQVRLQQQHIQATLRLLSTQFNNSGLYQWLSGQLSTLYFQVYDSVMALCLNTQACWQYEMGDYSARFIQPRSWDNRYRGLLIGEGLKLNLLQMEQRYISRNERNFAISKTISLRTLLADKWEEESGKLLETGDINFSFDQAFFDQDYPGHYLRQIAWLSVSLPAVVGPYQDIRAILTQTANTMIITPEIEAVTELLNLTETHTHSDIKKNLRSNQQIALSSGLDDSGLFTLNFNDERYLPFEGTGAISRWTLHFPHHDSDAQKAILTQLTDIIIHLRYTAKTGDSTFINAVKDAVKSKNQRATASETSDVTSTERS